MEKLKDVKAGMTTTLTQWAQAYENSDAADKVLLQDARDSMEDAGMDATAAYTRKALDKAMATYKVWAKDKDAAHYNKHMDKEMKVIRYAAKIEGLHAEMKQLWNCPAYGNWYVA